MSMNPPQGPPQPPVPPQPPAGGVPPEQPYAAPVDPVAEAKKRGNRNLAILGVVALALIVGSFFLGKNMEAKNYEAGEDGYNEIYAAGQQSGTESGTEAGKKEGVAEGTEKGKESGIKEGQEQGEQQGQEDGASAALGGLSGWSTDIPYIVEMKDGPSQQVPSAVDSRTQMQVGILYKICNSGNGVCTTTATSNGGGATGGP